VLARVYPFHCSSLGQPRSLGKIGEGLLSTVIGPLDQPISLAKPQAAQPSGNYVTDSQTVAAVQSVMNWQHVMR